MIIHAWNWDAQNFDALAYPDALFQPFLNWLLTTKRWLEDPELVNRKVLALQRTLAEYRQGPESHREPFEETRVLASTPVDGLAERRRANLAKARAAKKAKREAVTV